MSLCLYLSLLLPPFFFFLPFFSLPLLYLISLILLSSPSLFLPLPLPPAVTPPSPSPSCSVPSLSLFLLHARRPHSRLSGERHTSFPAAAPSWDITSRPGHLILMSGRFSPRTQPGYVTLPSLPLGLCPLLVFFSLLLYC